MLTLNPNTKKAQQIVDSAMHNEGYFLDDVYGRYSYNKRKAWDYCNDMCLQEKGAFFHICSHNDMFFSVAWFTDEGVRMETAYNSYFVPMKNAKEQYIHW